MEDEDEAGGSGDGFSVVDMGMYPKRSDVPSSELDLRAEGLML